MTISAIEAKHSLICLRVLIEELAVALKVPEERYERINRALNQIDERLKTCDALEGTDALRRLSPQHCPTCGAPVRFDGFGVRHYVGK